jgi:hypothetical protein
MSEPDLNLIEVDIYSSDNITNINIPSIINNFVGLEETIETVNQGLIHIKKELQNLIIENKDLIETNLSLIDEKNVLLNEIEKLKQINKDLGNTIKKHHHKPFFFF